MENFQEKIAAPFAKQSKRLHEIAEKADLLCEEIAEGRQNWESEKPVFQRGLRDGMKWRLRWTRHAIRLFKLKYVFPGNTPGKKAYGTPPGIGPRIRYAIADARKKALLVFSRGLYGLNPERALLYRMLRAHNIFWYRSYSTWWKPKAFLQRLENLAKHFAIASIVALMVAGAFTAAVLLFFILVWATSLF